MGKQLIASILYVINEVELSSYRFLSWRANKSKKQPQLVKLGVDREGGNLNREEKATGKEKVFLTLLDLSSTSQGQSVDWFPNRLSRLARASTNSTFWP